MASDGSADESKHWTCPVCDERHPNMDAKVAGGCLSCVDLLRYIEYEAPGMGIVDNDVSEVVCHNPMCDETIPVDPASLVAEDEDAVDVESEEYDMESGERTGYVQVEIYCEPSCRNDAYTWEDPPDA